MRIDKAHFPTSCFQLQYMPTENHRIVYLLDKYIMLYSNTAQASIDLECIPWILRIIILYAYATIYMKLGQTIT